MTNDAIPPPESPNPSDKPPSIMPAHAVDALLSLIPTQHEQLALLQASADERTKRAAREAAWDQYRRMVLLALSILLIGLQLYYNARTGLPAPAPVQAPSGAAPAPPAHPE